MGLGYGGWGGVQCSGVNNGVAWASMGFGLVGMGKEGTKERKQERKEQQGKNETKKRKTRSK